MIWVLSCVDGLLLNMEKVTDAEPINLGSHELTSIKDLAEKIIEISGKEIEIEYDLTGPTGTNRYCADTTRMEKVLGWKPTTTLEEGLKRTYEWAEGELNV